MFRWPTAKGFIDRLHVNFNDHFISYFSYVSDAARVGYTFRLSLSHEFQQFCSQNMCASRKDIGHSGTRTR